MLLITYIEIYTSAKRFYHAKLWNEIVPSNLHVPQMGFHMRATPKNHRLSNNCSHA